MGPFKTAVASTGLLLARACSAQTAPSVPAGFEPGVAWNIILHDPMIIEEGVDIVPEEAKVWDIDLGHAQENPDMIPLLKAAGKLVICYFNGGAVQAWDSDRDAFPQDAIGKSLSYPFDDEEWYVDIRDSRILDIMKARLAAAAEAGCDAVDPDNVDAWAWDEGDDADPTGFRLTEADYATYLNALAEHAHSIDTQSGNSLLVGQKNAPDLIGSVVDALDFAVLESCLRDSFCGDYQAYIAQGKPVFQIEYPPSLEKTGSLSAEDNQFFCQRQNQGDDNFGKILKWSTAQVDGWGQYCGGEPFRTPTEA
jgi:hypothetical protein